MAPLANDPLISGRLIQLFRNLEYQNPSIVLDSIDRVRMAQQFRRRSWNGTEEWNTGCDNSDFRVTIT